MLRNQYEQMLINEKSVAGKEILDINQLTDDERLKMEEEFAKKQVDFQQFMFDKMLSDQEEYNRESEKLSEQLVMRKQELQNELIDFTAQMLNTALELEEEKLEEQQELNDNWRDHELEQIQDQEEAGVISKEQADARKEAVDDLANRREEDLQKKREALQKRQAVVEMASALAKLAIETARTIGEIKLQASILLSNPVTAPLAAMALAQIPIVIATGVAQAAAIVASSVPKFAKGTKDHPGGLSVWGDGGRSELAITPDGRMYKSPAHAEYVSLPEHTVIYPDFNKAMMDASVITDFTNNGKEVKTIVIQDNEKLVKYNKQSNSMLKKIAINQQRQMASMISLNSANYLKKNIQSKKHN